MATTRKNLEAQVLRMLNLPPDVTIDSSEAKLDSDLITLKLPDPQDHICSDCGAAGCIVKGSGRWQELRHFPVNKRGIVLRIFKRRFYCPDCGRSFYETPEWAVPRLRMTLPLFHALFGLSVKYCSFSADY